MTSPCDTCHQRCCHHFVVTITGYDAWLIVRGLRLEPEQFLVTAPQSAPNDRGFLLDHTEQTHDLALAKASAAVHEQACIFWRESAGWTGRCGIYHVRPYVCRAYPAMFIGGEVTLRWDALCPPGAWRDGTWQRPGWRENMLGIQVEFDIYRLAVARWNQTVRHAAVAPIAASAYMPTFWTSMIGSIQCGRVSARRGGRDCAPGGVSVCCVGKARSGGQTRLLESGPRCLRQSRPSRRIAFPISHRGIARFRHE